MNTLEILRLLYEKRYINELGEVTELFMSKMTPKNLKEMVIKDPSLKEIHSTFIKECGIPSKANTLSGGFYWVNRYSETATKKLKSLLKNPRIDNDKFKACTKNYYNSTSMPKTFTNFIVDGIWEGFYDNYEEPKRRERLA